MIYDAGDNVSAVIGASGGSAVDLKGKGDSVTVTVNAESASIHKLMLHYSHMMKVANIRTFYDKIKL